MKRKTLMRLRALQARVNAAPDAPDAELLIYGDIGESWFGESVTARQVVQQLGELQARHILVRINSLGGSVSDGTAIHNALRAHGARITTRIEGTAASIGSLIAMAGHSVEMAANATLMIHAPWSVTAGNAPELREAADRLELHAQAMATSYARKSGRPLEDELAQLMDGKDHWYTATQAQEAGYVDAIHDAVPEPDEADARAMPRTDPMLAALTRYRSAPAAIAAALRPALLDAVNSLPLPAAPQKPVTHPAASAATPATPEEHIMKWRTIAQALGLNLAADASDAAIRKAVMDHLGLAQDAGDEAVAAALIAKQAAKPAAPAAPAAPATPAAAVQPTRREQVDEMFAVARELRLPPERAAAVENLRAQALINADRPVAEVRTELLAALNNGAQPVGGAYVARTEAGDDARDKRVRAAADWLVARAGLARPDSEIARNLAQNPYRGFGFSDIARDVLEANGVSTRRMGRIDLIEAAIRAAATHTTSDFPNIFENALHKTLVLGAQSVQPTWRRFCKIGSLSDLRPHIRYRRGSFSNLLPKNQAGEFQSGTIGDAERESITGATKGRILNLTREMLINDDMSVFTDVTFMLGQASERTVEIDVYALFALNGGNGPSMGDGKALFHADHKNIVATAGAPSVATFEAARVAMATQKDPGDNDFLDIRPAIWLGPVGLSGEARVVNDAQYDPDTANKLQRPNKVRGLYRDLVDTPRLTGTAWYSLAEPAVEPVIEVAFLDGVPDAQLKMEEHFDTAGLRWRVLRDYATGAIGWRGINKNAGA